MTCMPLLQRTTPPEGVMTPFQKPRQADATAEAAPGLRFFLGSQSPGG